MKIFINDFYKQIIKFKDLVEISIKLINEKLEKLKEWKIKIEQLENDFGNLLKDFIKTLKIKECSWWMEDKFWYKNFTKRINEIEDLVKDSKIWDENERSMKSTELINKIEELIEELNKIKIEEMMEKLNKELDIGIIKEHTKNFIAKITQNKRKRITLVIK